MAKGSGTEMVFNRHTRVWFGIRRLSWTKPLLMDSSIRDFQQGKSSYMANALENPLLLPQDMVDLRTIKKHEVFLTLKRDVAMVRASTYYLLCSLLT